MFIAATGGKKNSVEFTEHIANNKNGKKSEWRWAANDHKQESNNKKIQKILNSRHLWVMQLLVWTNRQPESHSVAYFRWPHRVATMCRGIVAGIQPVNRNIAKIKPDHVPNCWQISDPNAMTMQLQLATRHLPYLFGIRQRQRGWWWRWWWLCVCVLCVFRMDLCVSNGNSG